MINKMKTNELINKKSIDKSHIIFLEEICKKNNINEVITFEKSSLEVYKLYQFRYNWYKEKSNRRISEMEEILSYLKRYDFTVTMAIVDSLEKKITNLVFINKEKNLIIGILKGNLISLP